MSYNGSGTFNINTSGQPVVTGTVISSTAFNALTADLGTGLSTAITKNGQTTVTANIPFNGFKLTGIGVATASGDALTYGQAATVTTLVASTSITDSGLTSGRVTYAGTAGLLQDSANLTFSGSALAVTGTLSATGTLSGGTSGTGYSFSGSAPAGSLSLDSSGNLGLGVTPSAWSSTFKGFQLGSTGSIWAIASGNGGTYYGNNYIYGASGRTYLTTGTAVELAMASGKFEFGIAASGTAGNPVSFTSAMTLDSSGNLGLGGTPVNSGSTTALTIYNATAAALYLQNSTSGTTSSDGATLQLVGADLTITNRENGYIRFNTNNTERMRLDSSGIVTMNAYGAGAATFSAAGVISSVSDETWKVKDGAPVDTDAMLNKLEPGYWYYNDEKKDTFGKDRQLGFYAQNVNAAIGPEAAPEPETFTTKNEDGTETITTKPWGYYDRSVLAVTVMSLQKALATIESLTARITALEAK